MKTSPPLSAYLMRLPHKKSICQILTSAYQSIYRYLLLSFQLSIYPSCTPLNHCSMFAVLGIIPKALCILGKHPATKLHPQPCYVIVS